MPSNKNTIRGVIIVACENESEVANCHVLFSAWYNVICTYTPNTGVKLYVDTAANVASTTSLTDSSGMADSPGLFIGKDNL